MSDLQPPEFPNADRPSECRCEGSGDAVGLVTEARSSDHVLQPLNIEQIAQIWR
jgi:hypothetical protein